MKKRVFYGTLLAALLAGLCLAAPKPAIVQRPGQWTVEVRYEHPQQITAPWSGSESSTFWYMIVTATNRTGQDVEFYPKCDLMTDTFEIVPAGRNVPPAVFQLIQQRHGAAYPFLEPLDTVANRLLQGEDNAKDIAIIWRDFDPHATGFNVFVAGLSNETALVHHPVATNELGQPLPVFLRKTLELTYTLRSDPTIRPAVQAVYKGQDWVMR